MEEEVEGENENENENEKITEISKVSELFMVGINSCEMTQESKTFLLEIQPGSLILTLQFFRSLNKKFGSTKSCKEYVKNFLLEIRKILPNCLIGCDHEGGFIQNFAPPDFTLLPPQRTIGEKGENDLEIAYMFGVIIGKELRSVGVDWVFGPVLDSSVERDYHYRFFGRTFSDDPKIVSKIGMEVIRGMEEQGLISSPKHFPNMGSTNLDSHRVQPRIKSTEKEFEEIDLFTFREVIKAKVNPTSIMTNHARYVNIDDQNCATFSKKIMTEILRDQLGFEGVLITDDLGMGGIYDGEKLTPVEVCTRALLAGNDCLMYSFQTERARSAIIGLNKLIEDNDEVLKMRVEESFERIKTMKMKHFEMIELNVIGCEENKNFAKEIGYKLNDKVIKEMHRGKKQKKDMTVGSDSSKLIESESNKKNQDSEGSGCSIL